MNYKTMKNNITYRRASLAVLLACLLCITSCDKQAPTISESTLPSFSVAVDRYKNKGLEITYPTAWNLLHDEPGIFADRTVAFETPEASRITVFFYKSKALTSSDVANDLEQQLRLRSSSDVKDFERDAIELEDHKGLSLSWRSVGLTETDNQALIIELRSDPYPVMVQFLLFDQEIQTQKTNLVPFLQGISFDPQGVIQ